MLEDYWSAIRLQRIGIPQIKESTSDIAIDLAIFFTSLFVRSVVIVRSVSLAPIHLCVCL